MLSDRTIRRLLAAGVLQIEPLTDPDQVQPASVDLRLGGQFQLQHPDSPDEWLVYEEPDGLVLQPGDFRLGHTAEWVGLPDFLAARVDGRSSLGRLGVTMHVTAGFIDPGFQGQVTLEIANLGERPVTLKPGMRVCQLELYALDLPCARPYQGRYQFQSGAVPSRLGQPAPPAAPREADPDQVAVITHQPYCWCLSCQRGWHGMKLK